MAELRGRYRIAFKRLAAVDVDRGRSNQREIGGVGAFRQILNTAPFSGLPVQWVILRDDEPPIIEAQRLSWYDTRERSSRSAEWRLYFHEETAAKPGDLFAVIRRESGELAFVVAPGGTSWERQILAMLEQPLGPPGGLITLELHGVPDPFIEVTRELFELVGWADAPRPAAEMPDIDEVLSRFGKRFPPTAELSAFVRQIMPGDSERPDETLVQWWRTEERIFLELERILVEERLQAGFEGVDDFLQYSLSVQNRRKSRAGHALEHHLRALFIGANIRLAFHPRTEGNREPDFLFPGVNEYRDPTFPATRLSMLGVKTTCKDRWRQVLSEAARIAEKHLCTLEPAISRSQLTEMAESQLTLVVPESILPTYDAPPGYSLLTVGEFMELVANRQAQ